MFLGMKIFRDGPFFEDIFAIDSAISAEQIRHALTRDSPWLPSCTCSRCATQNSLGATRRLGRAGGQIPSLTILLCRNRTVILHPCLCSGAGMQGRLRQLCSEGVLCSGMAHRRHECLCCCLDVRARPCNEIVQPANPSIFVAFPNSFLSACLCVLLSV